ncbi:UNVERIFIED_CONTAM: hypothetical protein H355_003488 [Colinus virginianus]|nr:hypothetical protein H355_003488 [Colinus virginianus]
MLRLLVVSAHLPVATGAGPGVHVYARFRGVPRSTRVVPAERSPTWNETLVWPLATRPLHPTDSLALRLQLWGQPEPHRLLGATTVSLSCLAEDPGLPLDLGQLPLQDPQGNPMGATISLRCSYVPPGKGAAGNAGSQQPKQVAPCLSPPRPTPVEGTTMGVAPRRHAKPAAGKKEDFQVRVRILEGHQLQGNAIKPVVTVLIGEQRFRSRIRAGNNPYYNELPPLCDAIELDILSGSKVLGTATLHLSHISSAGAELEGGVPGFLPCFGPSFLPFYGARRDAAAMPSDAAVAYRGRVLLEISTHTGDSDGRQQDTIAPEDVTRVQVGTR